MREMIYRQSIEVSYKWVDHFEMKLAEGFQSIELVLENLRYKPDDKKSDDEKLIGADIEGLHQMKNDFEELVKANQARVFAKQRELCKNNPLL